MATPGKPELSMRSLKAQERAVERARRLWDEERKALTHAHANYEHEVDTLRAMIRGET